MLGERARRTTLYVGVAVLGILFPTMPLAATAGETRRAREAVASRLAAAVDHPGVVPDPPRTRDATNHQATERERDGVRRVGRCGCRGARAAGTVGVGSLETLGSVPRCAAQARPVAQLVALDARPARPPPLAALRAAPARATHDVRSRRALREAVDGHRDEVLYCYARSLDRGLETGGRVTVRFVVGVDGIVRTARVSQSDIGSSDVEDCLVAAARRWTFPSSADPTTVEYPFVLGSSP